MTEAEQGSHSELGLPANANSPIPEMGGTPIDRLFHLQQMTSAGW